MNLKISLERTKKQMLRADGKPERAEHEPTLTEPRDYEKMI